MIDSVKTKSGNLLVNGRAVRFEYDVRQFATFDCVVVVVLQVPADEAQPDNVLAVDDSGAVLWRIDPELAWSESNDFVAVSRDGDVVHVRNFSGQVLELDPLTGRKIGQHFAK